MSTLVTATAMGMARAAAMEMCSRVMSCTPMLPPTTTTVKSGSMPVSPKTVVFRYRSCPQRSMSVSDRSLLRTTSAHRFSACRSVGTTCSFFSL